MELQHQPPNGGFSDPAASAARRRAKRALRMQSGCLVLAILVNLLVLTLFQAAAPLARALLTPLLPPDTAAELYTLLLYGTAFLLPYLAYGWLGGYTPRRIPRDRPSPPILAAALGICLAASAAGAFLTLVVRQFFAAFGLMAPELPLAMPSHLAGAVLFVLNLTVVPALVEEITYRGIVLGSLRQYGDGFAIAVSALLFALLHRNMSQFPNALLMGLVIGYFVVKTNSIWTGIVLHFTNNLLVLIFSDAAARLGDFRAGVALLLLYALYLALGALGLLYLKTVRRVDFSLRRSRFPLSPAACFWRFFGSFPALLLLLLYGWLFYLSFR